MKLKSLRLFGFKTFAEQTTLEFEPGITGIVGPNGSGKSNLVDAIRWVLGEQSAKSLRAGKTEDIIFAGNEKRKPLGMAEVALTFDNADGALKVDATEVQITRRAYRAGESEFFINRQHVRLRDIIDLFMGTGLGPGSYSIVSQGQIDAILSSKPTERRSLFEETAGISRFLARKAESLRRLEQTEANGIRINDLLSEIQARIPELETQARRARRYRRASTRLRDLEILSYLRASASRRAERARLHGELERLEAERTAAAAKAAALDAELSGLRLRLLDVERRIDTHRETATGVRAQLAECESRRAALSARRDALEAQSTQTVDDRERAEAEQSALRETVTALEAELTPHARALEAHRERERHAQEALGAARAALDRIFAALRAVEAAAAAEAASEAERRAQLEAAQREYDRLEREAFTLREETARRSETSATLAQTVARAREEVHEAASRLQTAAAAAVAADARVAAAGSALADAQSAYRTATSEVASAEARLHTIEELEANLEGRVAGTRAVMEAKERGELGGIHGVVSNLVSVDERYARALDAAFGAALSNIVTETSDDAERAIDYLRERELGRATFLPLDALGGRTGRELEAARRIPGALGYAHDLVEAPARYAGIVAFLVGRVLVTETLEIAMRLARAENIQDAIVTLDGEHVAGGGALTGGRYRKERSILSRRAQARTLSEALPGLRRVLSEAEENAAAAESESMAATAARDTARGAEGDLAAIARDVRARLEAAEAERARIEAEIAASLERAHRLETETDAARERLAMLERPPSDPGDAIAERERLEAALAAARETIARAQDAERTVSAEIAQARETVATLSARRDGSLARITLLDADRDRAAGARAAIAREIETMTADLAGIAAAHDAATARVNEVDDAYETARIEREHAGTRAAELDAEVRATRTAEREAASASEGSRLRLAEIDAELGMLSAQFAQNPATAEECADVEARYPDEDESVTADLPRLREELARLQNVNLNAEAEIAELTEREGFLKAQIDDLARARETLLASIREIENSSQAAFNETFDAVRLAFEDVYSRLFPGGQAKMWQTDPTNLSETGIEISAQPPGKKMMPLATLSGGERAMTASALIFALVTVKPSPFYLLDEVDAAMDDANVERFSDMVREVASGAQLLLVTHNKKTMELAARMYGVTMAEPGISSVVAADLTPIREREPALA
ncbi:MAG: chromosome segregation protein SMC [Candidatus Eremiobacteraeota bacterium]|nr:chromosome segregation protein SMC [Candidatus Eremiobacteraeota bacterium]